MTITKVLGLSALLLASAAAFAQMTPNDPSKNTDKGMPTKGVSNDAMWDSLDTNRDGYLTKDELAGSPGMVHNFDAIDTDHDGKISKAEWEAHGHHDR